MPLVKRATLDPCMNKHLPKKIHLREQVKARYVIVVVYFHQFYNGTHYTAMKNLLKQP